MDHNNIDKDISNVNTFSNVYIFKISISFLEYNQYLMNSEKIYISSYHGFKMDGFHFALFFMHFSFINFFPFIRLFLFSKIKF